MDGQVCIFDSPFSSEARAIQIMCEEAGLSHTMGIMGLGLPGNSHPFGKGPVAQIDGLELIECTAIVRYIDNAHNSGELIPVDPAAQVRINMWIAMADKYLYPMFEPGLLAPWRRHHVDGFPLEEKVIERSLPAISRTLGFVDEELRKDGAWTAIGFTLADVILYPILRAVQITAHGEMGIAQCPGITAWLASCEKRASIIATRWETER